MNRILIVLLFFFSGGIVIGRLIPEQLSIVAIYSAALGISIGCVIASSWCRRALVGLLVVTMLVGVARTQLSNVSMDALYRRATVLQELTGTVVGYPNLGKNYIMFTVNPDNIPALVRVMWFLPEGASPTGRVYYGDRVRVVGKCQAPESFAGFDYRAYLARRDIFATMTVGQKDDAVEVLPGNGASILHTGDKLRQGLMSKLDTHLSDELSGLAHGILFGDRSAMPEGIEESFRKTGLMHLLAVSGLHLGLFVAGLWFALRVTGLRPMITYPVVGVAVAVVLWLVGPRVSLLRAALMFAFLGLGSFLADLGIILKRWVDPLSGLAAAAVVLLAIRPTALFDVGFQLSFSATAAIVIVLNSRLALTKKIVAASKKLPFGSSVVRYLATIVVVSLAAQAGTAPFLAYHFGAFYPYVLLLNLVVIPLATVAIWVGLVFLLSAWTPGVAILGSIFSIVLELLVRVVANLSHVRFVSLAVPAWMGIWIGGIVLLVFGISYYCLSSTWYSTSI